MHFNVFSFNMSAYGCVCMYKHAYVCVFSAYVSVYVIHTLKRIFLCCAPPVYPDARVSVMTPASGTNRGLKHVNAGSKWGQTRPGSRAGLRAFNRDLLTSLAHISPGNAARAIAGLCKSRESATRMHTCLPPFWPDWLCPRWSLDAIPHRENQDNDTYCRYPLKQREIYLQGYTYTKGGRGGVGWGWEGVRYRDQEYARELAVASRVLANDKGTFLPLCSPRRVCSRAERERRLQKWDSKPRTYLFWDEIGLLWARNVWKRFEPGKWNNSSFPKTQSSSSLFGYHYYYYLLFFLQVLLLL